MYVILLLSSLFSPPLSCLHLISGDDMSGHILNDVQENDSEYCTWMAAVLSAVPSTDQSSPRISFLSDNKDEDTQPANNAAQQHRPGCAPGSHLLYSKATRPPAIEQPSG